MRTQLIFTAIIFFTSHIPLSAQNKHFESENGSGYNRNYLENISVSDSAINFLVIGDWGRRGKYYQKEVAQQMANASANTNASFIITTGDNFYPSGVKSVDDPLWNKSFENVYHSFALQKTWYATLGNHDYRTNPQAEVEYTQKSTRWNMPARYYSKKITIDNDTTQKILFVFIDTNPLIDKYYSKPIYSKQVKTQDTVAQRKWLERTLADKDPNIRWRIVAGHHPMYTSGKRIKSEETLQFRKKLENVFERYKVDAYICGHEHQLEYIKPNKRTHHFISGAGSEVRRVKGNLRESEFKASEYGFMIFSVLPTYIKVFVVSWEGKILFEQKILQEK